MQKTILFLIIYLLLNACQSEPPHLILRDKLIFKSSIVTVEANLQNSDGFDFTREINLNNFHSLYIYWVQAGPSWQKPHYIYIDTMEQVYPIHQKNLFSLDDLGMIDSSNYNEGIYCYPNQQDIIDSIIRTKITWK